MSYMQSIQSIDFQNNWIDFDEKTNTLKIEKKTSWGRFKAVIIKTITFGKYGHKMPGLARVVDRIFKDAVITIPYQPTKSTAEQAIASVKKLKALASANSKIEKAIGITLTKIQNEVSASALGFCGSKFILDRLRIVRHMTPQFLRTFVQNRDTEGKTFFHRLLEQKELLSSDFIAQLENALGQDLFNECLLIPDDSGKTPLDYALERGELALVTRAFPIPNNGNGLKLTAGQVAGLRVNLQKWIDQLTYYDRIQLKFLDNCPGTYKRDKLDRILSCLTAVWVALPELYDIRNPNGTLFPVELITKPYVGIEKHQHFLRYLAAECANCKTSRDAESLIKEWTSYEHDKLPRLLNVTFYPDQTSLLDLWTQALNSESIDNQNRCFNLLVDICNPFTPAENNAYFLNPNQISLCVGNWHDLIEKLLKNVMDTPNFNMSHFKKIMEMVAIADHDDFLEIFDSRVSDDYLRSSLKVDACTKSRAQELFNHAKFLRRALPNTLAEIRMKKALLPYLRARRQALLDQGR